MAAEVLKGHNCHFNKCRANYICIVEVIKCLYGISNNRAFLARLLILIKKGGLLQLKFGVVGVGVGVGVNIYLWAR